MTRGSVATGAVATALLFTIGEFLTGWYPDGTGLDSTCGAAGALNPLLLRVYYSVQIFPPGAAFAS